MPVGSSLAGGEDARPGAEREVSLRTAVVVVLTAVLLVAGVGTAIGYRVFWERSLQPSQVDVAIARWQAEVSKNPKSLVGWTELGVALYEKGQIDQAEEKLRKALSLDKNAARARYYLGIVYIDKGRFDEAIAEFKEILKRDINNPLVFSQMAKAYDGKKDYQNALKNLDYIIEFIDPSLTEVHYQRGEVLEKMGRQKEAIEAYRKAASFDPDYEPAQEALKRLGVKPPKPEEVLPGGPGVFFHNKPNGQR